jgi:hypothetical protein
MYEYALDCICVNFYLYVYEMFCLCVDFLVVFVCIAFIVCEYMNMFFDCICICMAMNVLF